MASSIDYMYCVVPASLALGAGVPGIDDAPVRLVTVDGLAALVSTLDGETYRADAIERGAVDVEWLRPRAMAHDRVLTWASDRASIVPMPMWTLFGDDAGVVARLREREPELRALLERVRGAREYTVRVFADATVLAASLPTLVPRLAVLEREAAAASPGQRYLLQRKLDDERKTERRAVARRVAQESYEMLARRAREAVRDPLQQEAGEGVGGAILNASFLVETGRYDDFRRTLTELVQRYGNAFRFDFTGPWPPYHFVRER